MSKLNKKILIVDDDSSVRESVSLVLQEQSIIEFEIAQSENVASAIEQYENFRPDVIILDINMPGKSGFDFLDFLNKNKHRTKTKVIMLSADDTLLNIHKAGDVGINEFLFLGKPFEISELQALVFSVCLPTKTKKVLLS